jgi:uncharacterized phosphosugar-binding protein
MLAHEWLAGVRATLARIETTQTDAIARAAGVMSDAIAQERWVHTFGCGHATLPVEEMYPRIGGFVGFHPLIELPLTFFTRITGEMGIHQFLFLERAEGYGREIMRAYDFDPRDCLWIFSHSGINNVNIDVALAAQEMGLKVIATGSAAGFAATPSRHSSGRTLFELADVVIDTCVPATDAAVTIPDHQDRIAPLSTMAFVAVVWLTIATVAERLIERGVHLHIHPSHNIPGDTTAHERLADALAEYKRRAARL